MDSLTSQILIDIIKHEMDMPADHVWIRDQNVKIPNDHGLYIVVGLTSAYPTANSVYMETQLDSETNELVEHQISQVNMTENIQIDIFSRSNDVIRRSWEVLAAMQSFYAQQAQEVNNFKIYRIPRNFINGSGAEGGSTLNRYITTILCSVWYRKDIVLSLPSGDYFDDFTTRVDDNSTIGTETPLIEFEINPDSPPPP